MTRALCGAASENGTPYPAPGPFERVYVHRRNIRRSKSTSRRRSFSTTIRIPPKESR